MNKLIYDDSLENKLNDLLQLDRNPQVHLYPVEESTYLGINNYVTEEGFQSIISPIYNDFIKYLSEFVKINSDDEKGKELIIITLTRLSVLYHNLFEQFKLSDQRKEWKFKSEFFRIHNPNKSWEIEKEEKYTRWAYQFFYKMSAVQLYFIEKIKESVILLLNPYDNNLLSVSNSKDTDHSINKSKKDINKFRFEILVTAKKESHNILQNIHKSLKGNGYINCTLPEFKQIFLNEKPHPIVWLKDYIHLSYLVKQMTGSFLSRPKSPSNYLISTKLFYEKKEHVFFTPKKIRHDKNPNANDKAFLDKVIKDSLNYFIKKQETAL